MSLIGTIEPFNPRESEITAYFERLDMLLQCNNIEDSKKVSLLLTLLGGEAYGTLKDLLAPALPSSKTFEELKATLVNYYSPKRLFVVERFKFYSAKQEENEDVKSFVARLKSLILHCDFKEFLQQALRDQLVCGLRSEGIKRKLLTEENLTFERAVQIAVSMEIAEGQLKVMRTETSTVNKINMQKGSKHKKLNRGPSLGKANFNQDRNSYKSSHYPFIRRKTCKRCSRIHPENFNCPAVNWECYSCHQKGHTAKSILCKNKVHELTAEEEGLRRRRGDRSIRGRHIRIRMVTRIW